MLALGEREEEDGGGKGESSLVWWSVSSVGENSADNRNQKFSYSFARTGNQRGRTALEELEILGNFVYMYTEL